MLSGTMGAEQPELRLGPDWAGSPAGRGHPGWGLTLLDLKQLESNNGRSPPIAVIDELRGWGPAHLRVPGELVALQDPNAHVDTCTNL